MKKCRVCKQKTNHFKKINNTKIYICWDTCSIEYVLRRFLKVNYHYDSFHGELNLILSEVQ